MLAKMNEMALEYYGQTASAAADRGVCVKCSRDAMRAEDFRDAASRAEAANTVLCQACQDEIFGAMAPPADPSEADSDESDLELEPDEEPEMERPAIDPANDRTCKGCGTRLQLHVRGERTVLGRGVGLRDRVRDVLPVVLAAGLIARPADRAGALDDHR